MTTDYRPTLAADTRVDLAALAQGLGFCLNGKPSVPQLLDALAECYEVDPGGAHLALKVLLKTNDLLPGQPTGVVK